MHVQRAVSCAVMPPLLLLREQQVSSTRILITVARRRYKCSMQGNCGDRPVVKIRHLTNSKSSTADRFPNLFRHESNHRYTVDDIQYDV